MALLPISVIAIAILVARPHVLTFEMTDSEDSEHPAVCTKLDRAIQDKLKIYESRQELLRDLTDWAASDPLINGFQDHVFPFAPIDLTHADGSPYTCPGCGPGHQVELVSIDQQVQRTIDDLVALRQAHLSQSPNEGPKPSPRPQST